MSAETTPTSRQSRDGDKPSHVIHPTFEQSDASQLYDPKRAEDSEEYRTQHMPDEATRDHARRMHYAAYRWHKAKTAAQGRTWQRHYFALRDAIVLGNRKLVYKAVRRRMAVSDHSDDLMGECHIVLIQAVAAYNPWLGIRFSTYAYTCLVRALSRQAQRLSNDWVSRSVSLDVLPDGPMDGEIEPMSDGDPRLEEFFRDDHPLLSKREKIILTRRFREAGSGSSQTLETVGKELGLSKERVRQVQTMAISKLRKALTD